MMKRSLFLMIMACCLSNSPFAQNMEVHRLDLETSIAIAKMKSYSIQILNQDLRISEFNLKSATSRFKTHVDMNLNVPNYTETIRQFEDSTGITFYPIRQSYLGGNLTINQPLPTDGNIFIRSGLSGTVDYYDDVRFTRLNTRLEFVQPVVALYGYNRIKTNFKQAKLNYEFTKKRLTREEMNLIYSVSSSFYNMVSLQKKVEIASQNLERQKEAHGIAQNKYKAGLIREVDALQMEVDLAEAYNNFDINTVNLSSASNLFKELIGLPLSDSITIVNTMEFKPVIVDMDDALKYAMDHRLELREQDIQIELNELSLKRQKAEGMISGNINASYDLIGVDRISRFNDLSSSLNNAIEDLQNRPANLSVGLTINIPIIDWGENGAKVKMEETRLQQEILQKAELERSIEAEVRNLVASYKSSFKRLLLLEKNLIVAEKSFKITLSRYSDGDIDSQALALERDRLNNAYLSHLSAYLDYELKLADLSRKTFYDFKEQRPLN